MGTGYAHKAAVGGLSPTARRSLGIGLLCLGILDLAAIHGLLVPRLSSARDPIPALTLARTAPPSVPANTPEPEPVAPAVAPEPEPVAPAPVASSPAKEPAPPAPAPAASPIVAAVAPAAPSPRPPAASAASSRSALGEHPPDFPHLLFPRNTAWVPPAAKEILLRVADFLAGRPELRVLLAGHTDDLGTPYQNSVLSLDRARRARNVLVSRGIDPNRIDIQGYGSAHPVELSQTPQARAHNRRVEITFR